MQRQSPTRLNNTSPVWSRHAPLGKKNKSSSAIYDWNEGSSKETAERRLSSSLFIGSGPAEVEHQGSKTRPVLFATKYKFASQSTLDASESSAGSTERDEDTLLFGGREVLLLRDDIRPTKLPWYQKLLKRKSSAKKWGDKDQFC